MTRKKWFLSGGLLLLLFLLVLSRYIPLSTKLYTVCSGGQVFKFSIINPNRYGTQYSKPGASYDGGLTSFRNFSEYENSLQRSISLEACTTDAHDTAKLYLW